MMTTHWFHGWRLTALITLLLSLMTLGIIGAHDFSADGLRMAIRATARTSLLLFLPVFAASALVRLQPNNVTRWLHRSRRYLGVSFAASHILHAGAITAFAATTPDLFWSMTSSGTLLTGGLAYAFIIAMTVTSFDGGVRWLGARNWRALHWAGSWYIAMSFIITNAKRTPGMPLYWLAVTLTTAVILLRLFDWWRRRRAARPASMPA